MNSGDSRYELILFTDIDMDDYELQDRILGALYSYPVVNALRPYSAQDLVQKRMEINRNLALKGLRMSQSPVLSQKNQIRTRYLGILGNLQLNPSPPTVTSKSPRSPPHLTTPLRPCLINSKDIKN